MARQLFILRHAKSAWDTHAASDFERPLAKRGERDVPAMGAWMHEQGLVPDHVVSSPAERAKQTVVGICRALGIKKKKIHWDDRVYEADLEGLLSVLSDVPSEAKSVLLVGHNPGLEFLFSHLVGDSSSVKTATLVHLETKKDWDALQTKCATLIKIKYPRELSPLSD